MKHRVFLVEDHPVVAEAITELIHLDDTFEVVGTASTGQEAYDALAESTADLVVADISLPGMNGLELTRALLERDPSVRVLVVSGHQDAIYTRQARDAGARGFVTKGQVVSNLLPALHALMSGDAEFIQG